ASWISARPPPSASWISATVSLMDFAVGLAVGAQAAVGAEIHEADGGGLAVAMEEHGRVPLRVQIAAPIYPGGHLVAVEMHAGEHGAETGERQRGGARPQPRRMR